VASRFAADTSFIVSSLDPIVVAQSCAIIYERQQLRDQTSKTREWSFLALGNYSFRLSVIWLNTTEVQNSYRTIAGEEGEAIRKE
jgi:hypothetical protein